MKKFSLFFAICILAISCGRKEKSVYRFASPLEGASVLSGRAVELKLNPESGSFDSVRYFIDSTLVGTRSDTSSVTVSTTGLQMGGRWLTAKVYFEGKMEEVTSSIVILPANPPVHLKFKTIASFPHDTTSYTQGLEFKDGIFYESDGEYEGRSSLRKVELATGKVLKKLDFPGDIFAEGLTVLDDKLVMLTWENRIGMVFNKSTFEKIREFPYQVSQQGWGLANDGRRLFKSDGANRIYFLNKSTYQEEGFIEVYDSNGPVDSINELEYIDGKIYANIFTKDRIVVINPENGAVEADLDLQSLAPFADRQESGRVLNGIAWDAAGKRLFVTGKKWNRLFQIQIIR